MNANSEQNSSLTPRDKFALLAFDKNIRNAMQELDKEWSNIDKKDPLIPIGSLIEVKSKGRRGETKNDLKLKQ